MSFERRRAAVLAAVLGLAVCVGQVAVARAASDTPATAAPMPFQDPNLPTERRVADLLSRLTLQEKVSQMMDVAPGVDRLGIPAYNWWNECLHGVGRAGTATVFPQAIGLGATWDRGLVRRVATFISDEARAKHHDALRHGSHARYSGLTYWSPNINIFRDPRWGRGQETYGEDPFLTSRLGVEFVKGLQGDDPRYLKLVATPKHLAVHSGPEPERHGFDAIVSERDLQDTYLPAFEAAIREGGALSVMCAYNRVNGQAACASDKLLREVLRKSWGFTGYVVSDCGAIQDIEMGHHLADSPEAASALAVRTGCDLECGNRYAALAKAVEDGLVSTKDLDAALTRLLTARFRLGMFDPHERVPHAQIPMSVVASQEHRDLALEAARESIVLLKNDGVLPLRKDIRSIAVVGPTANLLPALLGNYHGLPRRAVTPLTGIREKLGSQVKVLDAPSGGLTNAELTLLPPAVVYSGRETRPGLFCEYFANVAFEGQPVIARIERHFDFRWGDSAAWAMLPSEGFSVRMSGSLVPTTSGRHWLGVFGGGVTRVFLDGDLVIDSTTSGGTAGGAVSAAGRAAKMDTGSVELEVGRAYDLRIEHVNTGGRERFRPLWLPPSSDSTIETAVAKAREADVVVACVGLSPVLEGEEQDVTTLQGFRGGDRTDIGLPAGQEELLRALRATGKPLVVVLLSGSAVASEWANENASAVLAAWYPGEAGGAALADVLFGDVSPSGRLPVTFYRGVNQLPPFEDYSMRERTYRYFTGDPLYPFGHGLSYTRFVYSNLRVSPSRVRAGQSVRVSVDVTNAGARQADEVVQLYVGAKGGPAPVATRSLQGFDRVKLQAGETRTVSFTLTPRQMSFVDDTGDRRVEPGAIELAVGGKQPGFRGSADAATTGIVTGGFTVTGSLVRTE